MTQGADVHSRTTPDANGDEKDDCYHSFYLSEPLTTEEDESMGNTCSVSKRFCAEVGELRVSSNSELLHLTSKSEWSPFRRASETEPVYGTVSVMGRSRGMEDAIAVATNLCKPEISKQSPVDFFAVYDGHGGSHVSAWCRERMHVLLEEELMRVACMPRSETGQSIRMKKAEGCVKDVADAEGVVELWKAALRRSFVRMDEVAVTTCACGSQGYQCGWQTLKMKVGGSTAVVSALTSEYIVVANCGDSRAVLCRGGMAIPLSRDHKPDRPDELARIEAAGGRVVFVNEARIEGILAMSRAIGDRDLKPLVISEPEVTVTKRSPGDDECLIVATDGLWDVVSSQMACNVALKFLAEAGNAAAAATAVAVAAAAAATSKSDLDDEPSMEDRDPDASGSNLAAASLARLALARRSSGNISVIVVDLKRRREKKLYRL